MAPRLVSMMRMTAVVENNNRRQQMTVAKQLQCSSNSSTMPWLILTDANVNGSSNSSMMMDANGHWQTTMAVATPVQMTAAAAATCIDGLISMDVYAIHAKYRKTRGVTGRAKIHGVTGRAKIRHEKLLRDMTCQETGGVAKPSKVTSQETLSIPGLYVHENSFYEREAKTMLLMHILYVQKNEMLRIMTKKMCTL
jgi:hypothetical protein